MRPCLVAAYAAWPTKPLTPAPDDVLTIAPPPRGSISSISCFMATNAPRRLTATRRSHSSSGDLVRRLDRLLDAGVVERDVQTAEPLYRRVQGRANVPRARDVAGHGECLAARLLDEPGGFLVAVAGDVGDGDARSLASERERGGTADAGGRAGDERDLVDEARHGSSSALIASRSSIAR